MTARQELTPQDIADVREACDILDRIRDRVGERFGFPPYDAIGNARAALVFVIRGLEPDA